MKCRTIDQYPISVQIGQQLYVVIRIPAIRTYCPGTYRSHSGVASKSKTTIGANHIAMHSQQGYGHRTAGNPTRHYQTVDKPGLRYEQYQTQEHPPSIMVRNNERSEKGLCSWCYRNTLLNNDYAILIVMEMMQKGNIIKICSSHASINRRRILVFPWRWPSAALGGC